MHGLKVVGERRHVGVVPDGPGWAPIMQVQLNIDLGPFNFVLYGSKLEYYLELFWSIISVPYGLFVDINEDEEEYK